MLTMLRRNCCTLLIFIAFPLIGFTQQQLYGRIIKKGSREMLPGVNVQNASQEEHNQSDMGGNFKIAAATGDTLIFTSAGYRSDTVIVAPYMFDESFLVPLTPNVVALARVEVDEMTNYEQDSLKRREDYGFILDRKPVKLVNKNKPGD